MTRASSEEFGPEEVGHCVTFLTGPVPAKDTEVVVVEPFSAANPPSGVSGKFLVLLPLMFKVCSFFLTFLRRAEVLHRLPRGLAPPPPGRKGRPSRPPQKRRRGRKSQGLRPPTVMMRPPGPSRRRAKMTSRPSLNRVAVLKKKMMMTIKLCRRLVKVSLQRGSAGIQSSRRRARRSAGCEEVRESVPRLASSK